MQNYLIFKSLVTHIKQNNFLPVTSVVKRELWSGTDQESLFKKNLKTQPVDWYYRNNPVHYTVNSNGYRTKEFKDIDWSGSIVLFGCSNVFGVGLDDNDTLASQLERITGIPVINMGQGGTSVNYNLHNSVILANGYPTPRAVVQVWPGYDRCVFYWDKSVESFGSWTFKKNNYMDLWTRSDANPKINALMAQLIFRQMWKDRASIYECSFNVASAKLFECTSYHNVNKIFSRDYKDYARDLIHPGIETVKGAAEDIASKLCIN
jgi:hypothetical protein